jgi:hypothetical protein
MLQSTFIYAGLLPFVASAAIVLSLGWLRVSPQATWAWAVAGGFIVGLVGLKSESERGLVVAIRSFATPQDAADWLPILVLLALGASLVILSTPPSGRRLALALAGFLTIAATLRLLGGYAGFTRDEWTIPGKVACLALYAGVLGLLWKLFAADDGSAGKQPERQPLLVFVAIGAAIVLTLSGVLVYGQYCGALAASLTGAALACSVIGATGYASARMGSPTESFKAFNGVSGAAGVLTFALGGLIILGDFFASLTTTNAGLLFVSLAAAGTALPGVVADRPAWQRVATRAVLCLVPLAVAIVSVVR